MKFIDEVNLTLSSGKGGKGCVSFRREAFIPRGGPDGGDGGRGGDVIVRPTHRLNSLNPYRFKRILCAKAGNSGEGHKRKGADGEDLVLEVPFGTRIRNEQAEIVVDISEPGDHLLLKGGRGGKGNFFFRSSVNQAPTYAQPGEGGEEGRFLFELSLIADVGLIGFPNAGKSSLISSLSAARPKIADYPFTTLSPFLGVVTVDDERSFVLADIPGLIKGAHEGVGLGLHFLRHIERTRLLLHVIDVSQFSGRDPLQDYHDILGELEAYDELFAENRGVEELSKKPQLVLLNKCDTLTQEMLDEVEAKFSSAGVQTLSLSAVTRFHLKELTFQVAEVLFDQTR